MATAYGSSRTTTTPAMPTEHPCRARMPRTSASALRTAFRDLTAAIEPHQPEDTMTIPDGEYSSVVRPRPTRPPQKRAVALLDVVGQPIAVGNTVWAFLGDLGFSGVVERVMADRLLIRREDGVRATLRPTSAVVMDEHAVNRPTGRAS
jgi:hypothetical protein